MFDKEKRFVDDKIFIFKKKIRKNKLSLVHISDNFEEAKRNAIFLSRSVNDYPAKYFFKTQNVYKNKKIFFDKLKNFKKLKYIVLRKQQFENEDIDILTNNYFLFKRASDSHSYKLKNLKFLTNAGDPIE